LEELGSLLPSRDAATWTILAATALAGGALRGLTGFGAALVMAPVLSLVVSARETMCLVTLLSALPIGQNLSSSVLRQVDRGLVAPMAAAAMLGIPVGIWLVEALPAQLFGALIGAAVILSALALLSGTSPLRRRSLRLSLGVGALSGVLTGFGGVGGPPAILYVLGVEPDAHRARASFIVFFACLYPLALCAIAAAGLLGWAEVAQGLLLAPLFHVGGVLGEGLYRVVNQRQFRRFVLALLILAGGLAAAPRHAAASPDALLPDVRTASMPAMVHGAPTRGAHAGTAAANRPQDAHKYL